MKWCRVRTPEGPRFGMVEGETIALIDGTPFDGAAKTGKTLPLAQAQLLVPVVPGTFYAIGSNYRDHIEKMAQAADASRSTTTGRAWAIAPTARSSRTTKIS